MEKQATVTSVQANGTWEGQYGLMYKFEIAFDNGDAGEYSSNKYTSVDQVPFKQGEQAKYEYVDGKYPKVKLPKKDFTPSGGGFKKSSDKVIARQSSLKIAMEYFAIKGLPGSTIKEDAEAICDFAEILTDYVLKDSSTNMVSTPQNNQKVPQNAPKPPQTQSYDASKEADLARQQASAHLGEADDLPF